MVLGFEVEPFFGDEVENMAAISFQMQNSAAGSDLLLQLIDASKSAFEFCGNSSAHPQIFWDAMGQAVVFWYEEDVLPSFDYEGLGSCWSTRIGHFRWLYDFYCLIFIVQFLLFNFYCLIVDCYIFDCLIFWLFYFLNFGLLDFMIIQFLIIKFCYKLTNTHWNQILE